MKKIYGYKGFKIKQDGTIYCEPNGHYKEYKVGEIIEVNGKLKICENGIHFCRNLNDVYNYYAFYRNSIVIGKVEILGDIVDDEDGKKSCTNKLKIVKLYSKKQLMNMSNTGHYNTGYRNTGNSNTGHNNIGDSNTGYDNIGNRNTGSNNIGYNNTGNNNTGNSNTGFENAGYDNTGIRNIGDYNTGYNNTGSGNTGNSNIGDRNTGHCNTGNNNIGDWNSCNYSNGIFNTISPKINLFNKPSEYTLEDFKKTKWYIALTNVYFKVTEWVEYTEEEKIQDKAKRIAGGRIVAVPYKEACAKWWKSLNDTDKAIIQTMPNFDAKIFEEITGIRV